MKHAWQHLHILLANLDPMAESWTPNTAFRLPLTLLSDFEVYFSLLEDFAHSARRSAICHLIGHAGVAIVFVPAAWLYFRILRRQMQRSSVYNTSSISSQASRSSSLRLNNLRRAYWSMIMEALAVSISATTYVAICIWFAVDTRGILQDSTKFAVFSNLPFDVFTVFGLPANSLIAWRLWRQTGEDAISLDDEKQPFGPLSLADGIRVETQVAIAVDSSNVQLDDKKKMTDFRVQSFDDDLDDDNGYQAADRAHHNTPEF